jgi:translation initiation factor 5A
MEKSKPGKHGSKKARIIAIGIFDHSKRSIVSPLNARIEVPQIKKRSGQILSLTENSVQLMDLETYDVFYTHKPSDEKLNAKLSTGLEVEFWRVSDRTKIMRIKGGSHI